jgi:hypothetical protein
MKLTIIAIVLTFALSANAAGISLVLPAKTQLSIEEPIQKHHKSVARKKSLSKVQLKTSVISQLPIDDDDDLIIDNYLTLGRNRRVEAVDQIINEQEQELPYHLRLRLFLSRMTALKRYQIE